MSGPVVSPAWIVPPTTVPGGKPVTAVPGATPRLPVATVEPVFVIVEPASAANVPAVPRSGLVAACAAAGTSSSARVVGSTHVRSFMFLTGIESFPDGRWHGSEGSGRAGLRDHLGTWHAAAPRPHPNGAVPHRIGQQGTPRPAG